MKGSRTGFEVSRFTHSPEDDTDRRLCPGPHREPQVEVQLKG